MTVEIIYPSVKLEQTYYDIDYDIKEIVMHIDMIEKINTTILTSSLPSMDCFDIQITNTEHTHTPEMA